MVNLRCPNFHDTLWSYVTEYARLKKLSKCEALEKIVEEHMKFMAWSQGRIDEKGKKSV